MRSLCNVKINSSNTDTMSYLVLTLSDSIRSEKLFCKNYKIQLLVIESKK